MTDLAINKCRVYDSSDRRALRFCTTRLLFSLPVLILGTNNQSETPYYSLYPINTAGSTSSPFPISPHINASISPAGTASISVPALGAIGKGTSYVLALNNKRFCRKYAVLSGDFQLRADMPVLLFRFHNKMVFSTR